MSFIFDLNSTSSILIYSYQNQIIFRQRNNEMLSKSRILATDYSHNLSAIMINQSLYYSYSDNNNNLILKKNADSQILYMREGLQGKATIIHFTDRLVLINEQPADNNKILRLIFPFQPENDIVLPDKFNIDTSFSYFQNKNTLYIQVCLASDYSLYQLDSYFTFEKLINAQELILEVNNKNKRIQQLENALDSATQQYNSLMIVAEKYKEEAAKWCSKFTFKNKGSD